MGIIYQPSYLNIFINRFEKNLYPRIPIYLRFIDNIFVVWTDKKKYVMDFLNETNRKHQSIKIE